MSWVQSQVGSGCAEVEFGLEVCESGLVVPDFLHLRLEVAEFLLLLVDLLLPPFQLLLLGAQFRPLLQDPHRQFALVLAQLALPLCDFPVPGFLRPLLAALPLLARPLLSLLVVPGLLLQHGEVELLQLDLAEDCYFCGLGGLVLLVRLLDPLLALCGLPGVVLGEPVVLLRLGEVAGGLLVVVPALLLLLGDAVAQLVDFLHQSVLLLLQVVELLLQSALQVLLLARTDVQFPLNLVLFALQFLPLPQQFLLLLLQLPPPLLRLRPPLLHQFVGLAQVLLLVLRLRLPLLHLPQLLPGLLHRLCDPLLLLPLLLDLGLEGVEVVLEDAVLLPEQVEVLGEFGDVLVVGLADGLDHGDDFGVLLGDGGPEEFVLGDEEFGEAGGLGELEDPGTHVVLEEAVVALEGVDDLGEFGVGVGDDALLLVLLVGALPDEARVEVGDAVALPADLLDVARHLAQDAVVLLHVLHEVVELVLDGPRVDVGPRGGRLLQLLLLVPVHVRHDVQRVRPLRLPLHSNIIQNQLPPRQYTSVSSRTRRPSIAPTTSSTSPPPPFASPISASPRQRPSNRTESFWSTRFSLSAPICLAAVLQASSTASSFSLLPSPHSFSTASSQYAYFSEQKPTSYCSLASCRFVFADSFPSSWASAARRAVQAWGSNPICRYTSAQQDRIASMFQEVARAGQFWVSRFASCRQPRAAGGSALRCSRDRSSSTSRCWVDWLPKWRRASCWACLAKRRATSDREGALLLGGGGGERRASLAQQWAAREQRGRREEWSAAQLKVMRWRALRSVRVKSGSLNSAQAFIMRRQMGSRRVWQGGQISTVSLHFLMQLTQSDSQQWQDASSSPSSIACSSDSDSELRQNTSFFFYSALNPSSCPLSRQNLSLLNDSITSRPSVGYSRSSGLKVEATKRSLPFLSPAWYCSQTLASISRRTPKQCSMKEKRWPVREGRGGQPDCSSRVLMEGSCLSTRLKKWVSSISPCAERYTFLSCLQQMQYSSAVMISWLGQAPCRLLADLSPFTYLCSDSMLVEARSLVAICRKVRSIGGWKARLWCFSAAATRTIFFRYSLRFSSSCSMFLLLVFTYMFKNLPTLLNCNHSSLQPSSARTALSKGQSSPSSTVSSNMLWSKAMQVTPLYQMQMVWGRRSLSWGSVRSLRVRQRNRFWQILNYLLRFLMLSSLKKMRCRSLMRMLCVVRSATFSCMLPTSTSVTLLDCSVDRYLNRECRTSTRPCPYSPPTPPVPQSPSP